MELDEDEPGCELEDAGTEADCTLDETGLEWIDDTEAKEDCIWPDETEIDTDELPDVRLMELDASPVETDEVGCELEDAGTEADCTLDETRLE